MAVFAGMALADDGEIFGRDAKLLRKILYRLMLDFTLLQQLKEVVKEVAGARCQRLHRHSMVEKRLLTSKKCTLQQCLYDFTAIRFPRLWSLNFESGDKTHQIGKL